LNYTDLEAKLADLHHAEQRAGVGALRARIRMLRDLGVPAVPKVGKGARVEYSFDDLWESHFGLLLQEAGFPPAHVADVIQTGRPWMLQQTKTEDRVGGDAWVEIIPVNRYPEAPAEHGRVSLQFDSFDQVTGHLKHSWGQPACVYLLVNVSKITRDCT
jgi:hypothetical protein